MTAVMDERGPTLVRNWYDDSKILIAQVFANGDVYWYHYEWSPNNHYAEKVVVTLPDHNEKEISPAETVPDYIRSYREATSHCGFVSVASEFNPLRRVVRVCRWRDRRRATCTS
jgi:hypothetical protein